MKEIREFAERLKLTKIRQLFKQENLSNLTDKVKEELNYLLTSIDMSGNSIAIAVGSRGIANLAGIVKQTVDFLKQRNAKPFIVPAMGSHGGATGPGQTRVLEGYGITETSMGVPIRSSMEVVCLSPDKELPLYMDKYAFQADGIIVINRIKPHTDYHNAYESGLVKMLVIGLGKNELADFIHSYGIKGLKEYIPLAAQKILDRCKIIGGIAILENAYDKTMLIKGLRADEIMDKEPGLLSIAKKHMPSFPVKNIDILIVDIMGKDISGAGIDPNIIARIRIRDQEEPAVPCIKSIMVSDLSPTSHGNALGMGLADVITKRLFDKINFDDMYANAFTSSFLERAKIPVIAKDDIMAFTFARRLCGYIPQGEERIIRILDTLHLGEIYVSSAILKEISNSKYMGKILHEDVKVFNSNGCLNPF